MDREIPVLRGLAVHLDPPAIQIDEPVLRHPGPGVEWPFGVSIVVERHVGDFDDEMRILRRWMPIRWSVSAKHRDVRHWLREVIEAERVEHARDDVIAPGEHASQIRDGPAMADASRVHLENLALDQLDALLVPEDASRTHLVVLGDIEQAQAWLHRY